ncbi:MAG TPA: MoaD/ThiS family protein [Syntrophomonadaceae bacterium]|nr:MoaD/ThiS family protein [Syntrophomonadaceae bacterium]
MSKIKVHFYGLIKGDFFVQEFEVDSLYTLGDLEKDIVRIYGNDINEDYKSNEGLLNHKLVRVGDVSGKRLDDLNTDISGLSEIWFVVPFAGG